MIYRMIHKEMGSTKKSILLFGPRQVGKSTLIKSLKPDLTINLSEEDTYLDFAQDLSRLKNLIERQSPKTIFIDEVQRIPSILNSVQALVDDNPKLKFYLTGSSARKLKKGGANLLPGRVINYRLGPLTIKELNYKYQLQDLQYGFLPGIYSEPDIKVKKKVLISYSSNYVTEEIKAESLVRDLPAFSRFLMSSTENAGQFIDYSKISKSAKISRHSVPRYFEIFEDTLIGQRLFPDPQLIEKYDLIKHPKFYFFDVGVYNGLVKSFDLAPERLGILTEQLIYQQLLSSAQSLSLDIEITTLRTRSGAEIDFWIKLDNKKFGLEVKTSDKLSEADVRHLVLFKKNEPKAQFYLFHFGQKELKINDIWCLPWAKGFKDIGL